MVLSKTCDYGIRAALYIAANQDRPFVPIREVSDKLNISFHFLTKILQILTQNNIMSSFKGPKGGVSLARPAAQITMKEIVEAIDGDKLFTACVLGLSNCGDDNPCPLHFGWKPIREQLVKLFQNATLQDMAGKIRANNFKLSDVF